MYVSTSNINALIISLCVFNMGEGITVCIDTFIYNEYRVNTANVNDLEALNFRGKYSLVYF